jgi:apolipoprotein N-acyltransferase
MKITRLWQAIFAIVCSGALFVLSLDIGPIGALVLIAPIPIFMYALSNASTGVVFGVAFLARLIGAAGFVYAYANVLPVVVLAIASMGLALTFAISVLLMRAAARRLPAWLATLSFAMFTTAIEFVVQAASPHGTFGATGYSLINVLWLVQVASLGGVAAVTFVATLVPTAIALLIARFPKRQVVLAAGVPLAFALVYGLLRLNQPYSSEVKVAMASIDSRVMHAARDRTNSLSIAQAYADVVRGLPKSQLDAVVLPERMFADDAGEVGEGSKPLQDVATELNTKVIAGFDEVAEDGRHRNTARVFTPGAPFQNYTKRKLIPGLEQLTPGQSPLIIGDRGVAICKDLDFAPLAREYGERDVRMLWVPAWDFVTDGRFHSRMAVLRGVEYGFAIARAAAMGRLTLSDAYGRVVAETVTSDKHPVTLIATVGLTRASTVYARIGDVFAWFVVGGALLLLVWMVTRSRHSRSAKTIISDGSSVQAL